MEIYGKEVDRSQPWILSDLPTVIPIFPLDSALLLPRGRLPLNIFEPRYLDMIADAKNGAGIIGMVQPRDSKAYAQAKSPEIYSVGCLGRMVEHTETDDGRILIALEGMVRFRVLQELETTTGYRQVSVSYDDFYGDASPDQPTPGGREVLVKNLKSFFKRLGIEADWKAVLSTPDEALINSVAMMCPFTGVEKQALLEAPSLTERAVVLNTLLELNLAGGDTQAPH